MYLCEPHICDHCIMGRISVWLALLSLRSACGDPGPTITPDHYQAHMKAIKANLNQISTGSMSLFLCAYAREKVKSSLHTHTHTDKENTVVSSWVQLFSKCVCLFTCVLNWMKESWKEHFLKGSMQSAKTNGGKKNPLFSSPVYIT